ncbi:MAG: hypothetical protein FJ271_16705 [Planctomycetes bacterium]|nr:hypothetical protein [Planctomycetota bacterium]
MKPITAQLRQFRSLCRRSLSQNGQLLNHTDIKQAPWYTVEADDKRRARLNCIAHLLRMVPYEDATPPPLKLPPRRRPDRSYVRPPKTDQYIVPDVGW